MRFGMVWLMMGAVLCAAWAGAEQSAERLRASTFDIDVTPPLGMELAYEEVEAHWDLGLRAKGVVLLGAGDPIVLCGIDWIGIANAAYDAFRQALADAVDTSPERVAVHALHQHDAPACDFSAEEILKEFGHDPGPYEGSFAREVIERLAEAARDSLDDAEPVTHVGTGEAEVHEVASNRRILGEDGTVRVTRYTATRDPVIRAEPEGVIDPMVSLVSFWNEEAPVAVLSYYAVHPQSYYRTGAPNPDFPGVARFFRQLAVPEALHVHFTGAAGDLGAGKYNDGSPENRLTLAERLADGMRRAWENTSKTPVTPADVDWRVESVTLPLGGHMAAERFERILSEGEPEGDYGINLSARKLAWLRRTEAGHQVDLSCLHIGPASILHFPAETFVEYQLAAKEQRPDRFVTMAAYGEYGPGYIGTAEAYEQGGYETSDRATRVSPEVEEVLTDAIKKLLEPRP